MPRTMMPLLSLSANEHAPYTNAELCVRSPTKSACENGGVAKEWGSCVSVGEKGGGAEFLSCAPRLKR